MSNVNDHMAWERGENARAILRDHPVSEETEDLLKALTNALEVAEYYQQIAESEFGEGTEGYGALKRMVGGMRSTIEAGLKGTAVVPLWRSQRRDDERATREVQ